MLVKREQRAKFIGLIALPETSIEASLWVQVLAVGPGEVNSVGIRKKMNAAGQEGKLMLLRQWSTGIQLDPDQGDNSAFFVHDDLLEAIKEDN